MRKNFALILIFVLSALVTVPGFGQQAYWQQRISYQIDVSLDDAKHLLTGKEKISYQNNSPDTLTRLFFHLYWNAFQPNSSMDVRTRELGEIVVAKLPNGDPVYDWNIRIKDRLRQLKPEETGYQKVLQVKVGGVPQQIILHETILEVPLSQKILPGKSAAIELSFESQIPVQIRRSGRNSLEGIQYSMSQWYPKMAEYDKKGWHANPYIAREFYGVWGDYTVNITAPSKFMVAAGGDLLNANESGFGYEEPGHTVKKKNLIHTWKWKARNVHDFVWTADTLYKMMTRKVKDGPLLRFIYKDLDSIRSSWKALADTSVLAYPLMQQYFGSYPYKTYSFIHGGDGGMEYPMATLIKNAKISTGIHEWMHSWYQMLMGTNESLYAWMDEGFTSYATSRILGKLRQDKAFWYSEQYAGYSELVNSPWQEPACTHADHYSTNFAYIRTSYYKGAIFLEQLGYIIGKELLDKTLLAYYRNWRFKHPEPDDFIKIAERQSGMSLQWYKEYWIHSVKSIDYAIDSVFDDPGNNQTSIRVHRKGELPMPVDLFITYRDGQKEWHYIPLNLLYGAKRSEGGIKSRVHPAWRWTDRFYTVSVKGSRNDIISVEIDPSLRLADTDRSNNSFPAVNR